MAWMRVDDRMAFHAKVLAAGNEAVGAWVRAGAWSSGEGTDGYVPKHTAHTIAPPRVWKKLCEVVLAHVTADGGYEIHDFLDYNPPSCSVQSSRDAKSKARSEAGKRGAAARWGHRQEGSEPPHEMANANGNCHADDGKADGKPDGKPIAPIPIPIPDPPVGPPPDDRLPRGVVNFERPEWIRAYTEAVERVSQGFTFDPRDFETLRRVVEKRCTGAARTDMPGWISLEVERFAVAVKPKAGIYSGYAPKGFERWWNSDCPTERESGPGLAAAKPATKKAPYHRPAPGPRDDDGAEARPARPPLAKAAAPAGPPAPPRELTPEEVEARRQAAKAWLAREAEREAAAKQAGAATESARDGLELATSGSELATGENARSGR